jgi:hypothetical protein
MLPLVPILQFLTEGVRAYNAHQGSTISAVAWYQQLTPREKQIVEPVLVRCAMQLYGTTDISEAQAIRVFEFVRGELES